MYLQLPLHETTKITSKQASQLYYKNRNITLLNDARFVMNNYTSFIHALQLVIHITIAK